MFSSFWPTLGQSLTLSTVTAKIAIKNPVRRTIAASALDWLWMPPNDAQQRRRSGQNIYHCQIWLWRPWWDTERLHNAYVVFVMSWSLASQLKAWIRVLLTLSASLHWLRLITILFNSRKGVEKSLHQPAVWDKKRQAKQDLYHFIRNCVVKCCGSWCSAYLSIRALVQQV